MIRKVLVFLLVLNLTACAELQQVVNELPKGGIGIGNDEIASGLRQALDFGIEKQVSKLTQTDGFYKNDLVKIMGRGELKSKLKVSAHKFTATAKAAIEAAGGEVVTL